MTVRTDRSDPSRYSPAYATGRSAFALQSVSICLWGPICLCGQTPWKPNSHVLFAYQDIVPALFEGSASSDMLRLKCDASATDVGDRCGESVVLYRLRTVYERIFERELRELPMRLRLAKTCYATMLSEAIERWHGTGVDEDSKAWFLMHLQDVLTKELVEPGRINDERLGKLRSDIAFQLGI